MTLYLPDAQATEQLAQALAASAPARAVVHLHGDLGAGKSTLARAWLRALGVQGTIRSPTYTLLERYPLPPEGTQEAWHLDLYRIGDADELAFLGIDDDSMAALWLVEWPQRGAQALPQADLHVRLEMHRGGRAAWLDAASPAGHAWLKRLTHTGQLHALYDAD